MSFRIDVGNVFFCSRLWTALERRKLNRLNRCERFLDMTIFITLYRSWNNSTLTLVSIPLKHTDVKKMAVRSRYSKEKKTQQTQKFSRSQKAAISINLFTLIMVTLFKWLLTACRCASKRGRRRLALRPIFTVAPFWGQFSAQF